MLSRLIVASIAFTLFTSGATARPEGVLLSRDITYATKPNLAPGPDGKVAPNTDLKFNIALPEGSAKNRPCIVAIHGGAWRAGSREDLNNLIKGFAKEGFVTATISYRFCPAHRFPAQVEDCADAVRFLRAHADEYGIDPNRIGAIGFSAGAHLAMMLGVLDCVDGMNMCGSTPTDTAKVQAVVAYFGPTLLSASDIPEQSKPLVAEFVGPDPDGYEDRMNKASPITYVTPGDAPILMFQGTKDLLVPDTQATRMIEAMSTAGVAGRAEIMAGEGHGWGGAELERTLRVSREFFTTHFPVSKR